MKRMTVLLIVFFAVSDCMAQTIRICTKLKIKNDSICMVKACAVTLKGCDVNGIMASFNITLKSKPADSPSNPKANPGNLQKVLELLLPKVDIKIVTGKGKRKSLTVISKIDNIQIYENVFETSGKGVKTISSKKAIAPIKNTESYIVKIDKNNIGKAAKAAFDQLSFELVE